jgi:predicted 3-demethylubiquinone-9 3-methyltransferase (glyoxalase superfamily)
MQKISTCIVFNDQALAAVNFYATVFDDLKILSVIHSGEHEYGGPPGTVRTVSFNLFGLNYLAVNGGAHFATFNDGVSLVVNCESQKEIDDYWSKLTAGGKEVQCGWLIDKFGFRWQVVPTILEKFMSDSDPKKSNRVMQAILKMVKLDIKTLQQAYES